MLILCLDWRCSRLAPSALSLVIPGSIIVMLGMTTFVASVITVLLRKPQ